MLKGAIVAICVFAGMYSSKANKNNKKIMDSKETILANQDDLVFYVKFHLHPEYVEDFRNSLLELAEAMSKEETFVSTFLHRDPNDTTKYTIYERWKEPSMDAFLKNQLQGKSYRDDYESQIEEWSATSREISVLKPMNQWVSSTNEPSNEDLAFYVNFHIKSDKLEEWKEGALHVLNSMSVEETFVGAFLHQDAEDPGKFTLYERWAEPDMDAFVKNQLNAQEYRKVYEEQLPALVASPRTFSVLTPTENWNK